MQAKLADLSADEHGRFAIHGPATFVVQYRRGADSFYELCEAIWAHWTLLQDEQPALDAASVFYWLDLFAVPPRAIAEPVGVIAKDGQLEQARPSLLMLCLAAVDIRVACVPLADLLTPTHTPTRIV